MTMAKLPRTCGTILSGACGLLMLIGCGDGGAGAGFDAGTEPDGDRATDAGWRSGPGITVRVEPPDEVIAGERFDVAFELLGGTTAVDGVEVTVAISRNELAGGDREATASTDGSGLAEFELTIEQAAAALVLTASADHPDLGSVSIDTGLFDVVAASADAEASSIVGDAAVANGQDEAAIRIRLIDEYQNPVVGARPSFFASGEGNDYGACSETDPEGVATCSMTSTEPGEKTLKITAPVEVTGDTLEFLLPCDEAGVPFGGGAGSTEDPFRLCAPEHLNNVAAGTNFLSDAFIVARDIDLFGFRDFNVIGDQTNPFTGAFDGGGRVIENLTIHAGDDDDVGLFGYIEGAVIDRVALEGAWIVGGQNVGGLAGQSVSTDISDSYVIGVVEGSGNVGGLVGQSTSTASDDFGFDAGAIVGSFSAGFVDGSSSGGGLVGFQQAGAIADSYSTAKVDPAIQAGGLVGFNENRGLITGCYAAGVLAESSAGGLVGANLGGVVDSYWDEERSGTSTSSGGQPLKTADFAAEASFDGWDFADTWIIGTAPDRQTRPILRWQIE